MRKKIRQSVPVFLLIFASLACSQFMPGSSQPQLSGKIVYQSDQNGNFDLYSLNVRGGALVRLTDNSSNDISPAFISATNQIGFVSDRENGWNIYVIDALGANVKPITSGKKINVDYPDWSPDGKSITASLTEKCSSGVTSCQYDVYVMNADGTGFKNLTNTPASEWVPIWSPDGQKIAFASDRDGDTEIYIINKDGSGLVQLTNNKGYDGGPRWSPDGKQIAFETDQDGGDWDIYIMNADGSNPIALTNNTTNDFSVSWSPDGNWLVYISNSDGDNEIFIITKNGEDQKRLTNNSYNEKSPVWMP